MMAMLHAIVVRPIVQEPCPFARSHQQFEQAALGDRTLLNQMLVALGTSRVKPRPGEQNGCSDHKKRQIEEGKLQSTVSFTCKEMLMKLVNPAKVDTLQGMWFAFKFGIGVGSRILSCARVQVTLPAVVMSWHQAR